MIRPEVADWSDLDQRNCGNRTPPTEEACRAESDLKPAIGKLIAAVRFLLFLRSRSRQSATSSLTSKLWPFAESGAPCKSYDTFFFIRPVQGLLQDEL